MNRVNRGGAAYAAYLLFAFVAFCTLMLASEHVHDYEHALVTRGVVEQQCWYNSDCNHGECDWEDVDINGQHVGNATVCSCDSGWISRSAGDPCNYHLYSMLVAFLLSFFIGSCGVDWCYLANGNGAYVCAGVAKALTIGGLGIWWLVIGSAFLPTLSPMAPAKLFNPCEHKQNNV